MDITRRGAIAGIALAGGVGSAQASAAEADYVAPFAQARPRSLEARLADVLSVLDFGAAGDGKTDDTLAFQRAADAAAQTGKALFLPATLDGYLVTDTIQVRCRRIFGDSNYLDSNNRGTAIYFRPTSPGDLKACFALMDGMYGAGGVENMTVIGPTQYRRERLQDVVNADQLPNYSAFAPGVCAFGVYGANQPTFRNVATRNVKVGLLLDSQHGHVSSYDCMWNGLFGVYCHRNSEDYFFMGGTISGIFADAIFGTFEYANHNGGFHVTMYRVHMGFAPYGFYQVKDSDFTGSCLGLYGRLDVVRFERIGEAVMQFLPQSITRCLAIDSFGMSWSPIYRDYPKPTPSAWMTNLPPQIIPYAQQQQHMLRLGVVGDNVRLSWLGEFAPLKRSPYADNPGNLAKFERLLPSEGTDLSVLKGDFTVASGGGDKRAG